MLDPIPSGVKDHATARFWQRYCAHLEKHRVPESARPWYRQRIEAYIRFHRGRRLAVHQAADLVAYLDGMADNPAPEPWKLGQTAHALRILFCAMLHREWCRRIDWSRWN